MSVEPKGGRYRAGGIQGKESYQWFYLALFSDALLPVNTLTIQPFPSVLSTPYMFSDRSTQAFEGGDVRCTYAVCLSLGCVA